MNVGRINIIDAFRGLAVLSVVLFHYTDRIPYDVMGYEYPILPGLWSWGWIGPYWFFAISGFCMVGSIEKCRDAVAFLSKRLSRIYPAYFFALIVIIALSFLLPSLTYEPGGYSSLRPPFVDIIANFFFATDFGFEFVDGAFWTLVVELKFYLFLAVAYFYLFRKNIDSTTTALSLASICLSTIWLVLWIYPNELPTIAKASSAILSKVLIAPYAPFFALGLLAQQYLAKPKRSHLALIAPIILITCTIIAVRKAESHYAYEDAWRSVSVYLLVLLFVFAVLSSRKLQSAIGRGIFGSITTVLIRMGAVSYAWYLIHQDIGMTSIAYLNGFLPGWLSLAAVLVGTFVLAEVLSRTVEWRFRKRFELAVDALGRALLRPTATTP